MVGSTKEIKQNVSQYIRQFQQEVIYQKVVTLYEVLCLRDPITAKHSVTMAETLYQFAKRLDLKQPILYFLGGICHDVGKIAMSDRVLKGRERLEPSDFFELRKHVEDGYTLLRALDMPIIVCEIALYHHEKYDGSGYLSGAAGQSIPEIGRISSIVDTYAALVTKRNYQAAHTHEAALQIMQKESYLFDPELLDAFIQAVTLNPL